MLSWGMPPSIRLAGLRSRCTHDILFLLRGTHRTASGSSLAVSPLPRQRAPSDSRACDGSSTGYEWCRQWDAPGSAAGGMLGQRGTRSQQKTKGHERKPGTAEGGAALPGVQVLHAPRAVQRHLRRPPQPGVRRLPAADPPVQATRAESRPACRAPACSGNPR